MEKYEAEALLKSIENLLDIKDIFYNEEKKVEGKKYEKNTSVTA